MNQNLELKNRAQNLRVLYVEDEDDTRTEIARILQLFFKEVVIGVNGLEALELYKNADSADIDLVMTDLTMPKMDGLEMVKEMRKINHNQHIIILTAHNSSDNLMETIDLQLDGFLLKPLKMDKLLSLLLKITHIINLEKNES